MTLGWDGLKVLVLKGGVPPLQNDTTAIPLNSKVTVG